MFESLKSAFEKLKSLWLAVFLKNYIKPDDRKPGRYPEPGLDVDLPRFRDNYAERNSDPKTQEISEKVMEAVARLKSQGKF